MEKRSRWARGRTAALALSGAFLLHGCFDFLADECHEGETACDGNEVLTCQPPCAEMGGCGWSWRRSSCEEATCVDPRGGSPFCALSTTQDPKCDGVNWYCDGNSAVACNQGYALQRKPCGASGFCVLTAWGESICAEASAKDPKCPDDQFTSPSERCDGSSILQCLSGFAVSTTACPAACAEPRPGAPFCSLSSQRDPLCSKQAGTGYCAGTLLVSCHGGYPSEGQECGELGCMTAEGGARCGNGT
jgi:hypothetical protein